MDYNFATKCLKNNEKMLRLFVVLKIREKKSIFFDCFVAIFEK